MTTHLTGADPERDVSRTQFWTWLALVLLMAAGLRFVYPTADPPWGPSAGVVWHDEGAWVHNARSKVLSGMWRTDEWNPVFIAPVFTGLEYLSFRTFGVGLRQARLVSGLSGLAAVLVLGLGVARISNRRTGLAAAAILATTFVTVTFDRAALMEATMVAFLVVSWAAYCRASDDPRIGLLSGILAVLAFFTKAAAVCFVAGLAVESLLVASGRAGLAVTRSGGQPPAGRSTGVWTLAGLALGILAIWLVFVGPNWSEYRFYNWQTSVTRKPSYTFGAILDRASWFPIIHDFFTRMWLVTVLAMLAVLGAIPRIRRLAAGERLLVFWLTLGVLELILHDDGNERRFVTLIPPLVALASLTLCNYRRVLPPEVADAPIGRAVLWSPAVLFALYVMSGAMLRLPWLYEARPGVRFSAVVAALGALGLYASWPRIPRWLAADRWSPAVGLLATLLIVVGNLAQFIQWSSGRTYKNYEASVALRNWLPPGTPVHGKLANGLALENSIRPIFVGRGFGNYADRTSRDDIRFLLTYTAPRLGYEGSVITEVLDAYPGWRIVREFDVAETATGHDRAALIDKRPEARVGTAGGSGRARD